MNTEAFLQSVLARPMTYRVVTTFEGGAQRAHYARSAGAAENYAVGERRKIGRSLISRETGEVVRVVGVTVEAL